MRCGIAVAATALMLVATTAGAQDGGVRTEVFFGGGGFVVDEKVYSFDVGATAWLRERWGLGAWTLFHGLVGESMTDAALLFNPVVRYQRRLRRRGRSLHLAAGPGFVDSSDAPVRFVFLPYADVLYGIQAAGNRKFGLRVGRASSATVASMSHSPARTRGDAAEIRPGSTRRMAAPYPPRFRFE